MAVRPRLDLKLSPSAPERLERAERIVRMRSAHDRWLLKAAKATSGNAASAEAGRSH
jgi:hypothetical protein